MSDTVITNKTKKYPEEWKNELEQLREQMVQKHNKDKEKIEKRREIEEIINPKPKVI